MHTHAGFVLNWIELNWSDSLQKYPPIRTPIAIIPKSKIQSFQLLCEWQNGNEISVILYFCSLNMEWYRPHIHLIAHNLHVLLLLLCEWIFVSDEISFYLFLKWKFFFHILFMVVYLKMLWFFCCLTISYSNSQKPGERQRWRKNRFIFVYIFNVPTFPICNLTVVCWKFI